MIKILLFLFPCVRALMKERMELEAENLKFLVKIQQLQLKVSNYQDEIIESLLKKSALLREQIQKD